MNCDLMADLLQSRLLPLNGKAAVWLLSTKIPKLQSTEFVSSINLAFGEVILRCANDLASIILSQMLSKQQSHQTETIDET